MATTMRPFKQRLDGEVNGLVSAMSPTACDCVVVSAGTASAYTIPSNVDTLLFYSTRDIYVRFNATAAIPTVTATDGSAPMPNPGVFVVDSTDTYVSLISAYATNIYVYRWSK